MMVAVLVVVATAHTWIALVDGELPTLHLSRFDWTRTSSSGVVEAGRATRPA
jgi:hypothetical protein